MYLRRLGNSDLRVSRLGIGTWPLGGPRGPHGWGPQSDTDSLATLRAAFDSGVNWVDTAPAYGLGHAESIVGSALRDYPDTMVSTKCGLVWSDDGRQSESCLRPASIRDEVEASLNRLGLDVIDLYQIHWPSPREEIDEAWQTIVDLITEGKVRYAGVSNFNLQQLERLRVVHPVTALQVPYNMVERGIEPEVLQYCASHDIAVLGYRPLYAGLLSGTFTLQRCAQLPTSDWRTGDTNFNAPLLAINLELTARLMAIASGLNVPTASVAVAWALRRDELSAAIVGARQPEQLQATTRGVELTLPADVIAEIDALLVARDGAAREQRHAHKQAAPPNPQ